LEFSVGNATLFADSVTELENQIYSILLFGGIALAPVIFAVLLWLPAPYGRYARRGWGLVVSRRNAWLLMEAPAVVVFAYFFLSGDLAGANTAWIFFILWQVHYLNRSIVYPLRMRDRGKTNPLLIVVLAMLFNLWNGYLNGRYIGVHAADYALDWLYDPRFVIGLLIWLSGFFLNLHSDEILLRLRKPGETDYKIPFGGGYRFVSCPNYLGEVVEWTGFAILTWSPAGLFFAMWTAANLIPRARMHHQWYIEKFPDYPGNRKAVIPFFY